VTNILAIGKGMSILWGVKYDGSQGFPSTKLMAVNTGLARLRRLRQASFHKTP